MIRYWKIIALAAVALFVAGVLFVGAGILTGASPDRIAELLYGGWDGLCAALQSLTAQITALF